MYDEINAFGELNLEAGAIPVSPVPATIDKPIKAEIAPPAQCAREQFGLEKVIFVPNGNPPHKKTDLLDKEDRFEMVAAAVRDNPRFEVQTTAGSGFRPARGFDKIVAPATQVQLSDGLWFPVFATHEEALAFCRYVGGFARRVAPGAVTRSRPFWSDKRNGFLAKLSIQFSGWGEEKGLVLCRSNEVAGLALEQNSSWVLLPVKPYSHTIRTESGTLYVLFSDGTAFCRSQSDGACAPADALYFARSYSEACNAFDKGGALKVTRVPTSGLIPLYISGAVRVVGDFVHLNPRSFRRGTPVASVFAA